MVLQGGPPYAHPIPRCVCPPWVPVRRLGQVWACPTTEMQSEWMGERVATVDVKVAMANVIYKREAGNWGPNATFKFPTSGGTGGIWKRVGKMLPAARQHYNQTVTALDADAKTVTLASGATIKYNKLLSTMALDYTLGLLVGSCASRPPCVFHV